MQQNKISFAVSAFAELLKLTIMKTKTSTFMHLVASPVNKHELIVASDLAFC